MMQKEKKILIKSLLSMISSTTWRLEDEDMKVNNKNIHNIYFIS